VKLVVSISKSEPCNHNYVEDTYAVLLLELSNATIFIDIKDCIDWAGIRAAITSKDFYKEEYI